MNRPSSVVQTQSATKDLQPILDERIDEDLFILPGSNYGLRATRDIIEHGVRGVGEQFRTGAATYDERYLQIDAKVTVLQQACDSLGVNIDSAMTALDVGCGSGNGTFALLKMIPDIHVYATDLSPEMVELLIRRATQIESTSKITPIVADASKLRLRPNSFDFIIGSSMLHHLLDPSSFMDSILCSLRPGGVCVFTEPLKIGHLFLRQILSFAVEMSAYKQGLAPHHVTFFRDYIFTIDTMFRNDRSDPIFATLDDKWMFSRTIFDNAAVRNGLRHTIFGYHPKDSIFFNRLVELVRLGLGEDFIVPPWLASTIAEMDKLIDQDLRKELLFEAVITFTR